MDPYEKLANAIILRAVKDYRKALKALKRNPDNCRASDTANEMERFFRSRWFSTLTAVDGEMLIQRLNKEDTKL